MEIEENKQLKPFNTFGINCTARYFTEIKNLEDIDEILESKLFQNYPHLILGGGSNILLTKDYDGIVIRNCLTGHSKIHSEGDLVDVKAAAGENWHQFVKYTIGEGLGGLENLSLIPGCVGASPMQNIGAYGVEVKDTVTEVEAYSLEDKVIRTFSNEECRFGYRDSIFKQEAKGKYIITGVTYRLSKSPVFNTKYGAIEQELEAMGVTDLSLDAISQAVVNIRSSKLPNPAELGNSGSFFKNPVIPEEKFDELKREFPDIPGYPQEDGIKVPAGWMIESLGWKGKRFGDAGVHTKQALVLVNYGKASGSEIFDLSSRILDSVKEKFGIDLEREVNIV